MEYEYINMAEEEGLLALKLNPYVGVLSPSQQSEYIKIYEDKFAYWKSKGKDDNINLWFDIFAQAVEFNRTLIIDNNINNIKEYLNYKELKTNLHSIMFYMAMNRDYNYNNEIIEIHTRYNDFFTKKNTDFFSHLDQLLNCAITVNNKELLEYTLSKMGNRKPVGLFKSLAVKETSSEILKLFVVNASDKENLLYEIILNAKNKNTLDLLDELYVDKVYTAKEIVDYISEKHAKDRMLMNYVVRLNVDLNVPKNDLQLKKQKI